MGESEEGWFVVVRVEGFEAPVVRPCVEREANAEVAQEQCIDYPGRV
jgi:hypothetical protein